VHYLRNEAAPSIVNIVKAVVPPMYGSTCMSFACFIVQYTDSGTVMVFVDSSLHDVG
jgi:hypothetical protein